MIALSSEWVNVKSLLSVPFILYYITDNPVLSFHRQRIEIPYMKLRYACKFKFFSLEYRHFSFSKNEKKKTDSLMLWIEFAFHVCSRFEKVNSFSPLSFTGAKFTVASHYLVTCSCSNMFLLPFFNSYFVHPTEEQRLIFSQFFLWL